MSNYLHSQCKIWVQILTYIIDINIKIASKTTNTIKKHLQQKPQKGNMHDNTCVYELKCLQCPLQHIGQIGQSFLTRYNEHTSAIKRNKTTTICA